MPVIHRSIIKLAFILFLGVWITGVAFAGTIVSNPENVTIGATVVEGLINPLNNGCQGSCGGNGFLTSVTFSGFAYPEAVVHIWKDGIPKVTTIADAQGIFSVTLNEIYSPNALYTLYAIDKAHRQSLLLNYPIVIKNGYLTHVSGIRFAPTIVTDKIEVKEGDSITVTGYALPDALLDLSIEGPQTMTFHFTSKSDGTYQITIPLLNLPKGSYNLFVNYENDKRISKVMVFTIGEINIPSAELVANIPGDCNADSVINLIDFSVMAFWYGKNNPPPCVDTNKDNIIDLVDFSILAFYWTG